ncbi:MAG: hypothetical protein K1X89_00460 [Myxococcaceae bacterium]|nr:hypothetical protein [Myxococcaceae bacterium]
MTITRAPSSEALTGRLELRPFDSIESTQLFGHPLASLNVTLEAGVDTLELSLTVPLDALTRPREEHELPVEGSGWELGWMVGNVTVSHCPVHLAAAPTPPPGTDDERRGQG